MADDTTYSVFTSTQASSPVSYSDYLTQGPSNAILNCQASPTSSWYLTLWWYATGNGCPNGYSYVADGTASTCIYSSTISTTLTNTWECDFTVAASTTSTVDGGTTTLQDGEAATITGATQTTTVTETAQITSMQVSFFDPGAVTVLVTSTITVQGGAHKRMDRRPLQPKSRQDPSRYETYYNATQLFVGDLIKRQDNFECPGTDYYCQDGSACLGDTNPIICCANTLICIPYDWTAVFNAIAETDDPFFDTTTSWSTYYQTTYETANVASSTVTLTETDTETTTVTNVNYVTTVATASDATVTQVEWVTSMVGSSAGAGAGGAGGVVTMVSTLDGKTVTLVSETGGMASTLSASSTAIAASGSGSSSSSGIGVKVGVGVGVPIAVALFGLLFFLIYRHRQQQKQSRNSGFSAAGGGAETGPNDVSEVGGRPMSNLPQYTPMAAAGAGVGAGMNGGPPMSELKANELPRHTADELVGDGVAEAPAGTSPRGGQYPALYYQPNDVGGGQNDMYRRHELPSPVHEMHELPGYYGT